MFIKLNTEQLEELDKGVNDKFQSMSGRSYMYTPESLRFICMMIGRELIEYKAREIEIKVRESGISDGLINYLDVAIQDLSDQYYGAE